MDIAQLQPYQKQLDTRIEEGHGLEGKNLLENKVVALLTELYECVNEARWFKYWKVDRKPKPGLLEEYVDTIHFALSLANDFGLEDYEYTDPADHDLNYLTIGLTNMITQLPYRKNIEQVLNYLIKFGYQLGFDEQQVIDAYLNKNKVNHERQESGY